MCPCTLVLDGARIRREVRSVRDVEEAEAARLCLDLCGSQPRACRPHLQDLLKLGHPNGLAALELDKAPREEVDVEAGRCGKASGYEVRAGVVDDEAAGRGECADGEEGEESEHGDGG